MLDYSQIKAGKFRKNYKEFNIRHTIGNIMEMQGQKAKDKGLKFESKFIGIAKNADCLDFGYSPMICCDEQRIMQVCVGLLNNSLKFT